MVNPSTSAESRYFHNNSFNILSATAYEWIDGWEDRLVTKILIDRSGNIEISVVGMDYMSMFVLSGKTQSQNCDLSPSLTL